MPMGLRALLRACRRARKGAVAIQLALMMTGLLGMVALGTEISLLVYKHRQMQAAADSAALGAATALSKGYPAEIAVEARALAAAVGYVHGAEGVTVTVNHPPAFGTHAGETSAVQVIVAQPQTLALVGLFPHGPTFDVGAQAVATLGGGGHICILSLDPTAASALVLQNNATVTNVNCGVGVNSSSNTALVLNNNAHVAGPVSVVGNWTLGPGASLDFTPTPTPHRASIDDPYASLPAVSPPACSFLSLSSCLLPCTIACTAPNNSTVILKPGYYKAGWNYNNNQTLNLNPGTYYIDARLTIGNGVTVNATGGVTLVVMNNVSIGFGNSGRLNITAPTTATSATPYPGMAIIGLGGTASPITQSFPNGTILNVTGAIYFPHDTLSFLNNGAVPGSLGCTQLIASKIILSNNIYLNGNCAGTGAIDIDTGGPSKLVE